MLSLLVIAPLSPALRTLPSRFASFLNFCWFCIEWVIGCTLVDWASYWLIASSSFFFFWVIYQTWNCLSDGTCTKTLRQHSDYVTCLAAAEKNVISVSKFLWILLTHGWNFRVSASCYLKMYSQFSRIMLESIVLWS